MKNTIGLQTGNLVLFGGIVHQLQTVGQWCHTNLTIDEIPLDKIEPIPLTEEWLVKLGFDFIEEIGSYANKNHTIKKCNDGYWFEPMCTSDSDCYIKIDFVHQVQNICFVFGEELTISE